MSFNLAIMLRESALERPDKTAIIQIKLESTTSGTLYVDNIYFAGSGNANCGTNEPTCAPTTVASSTSST